MDRFWIVIYPDGNRKELCLAEICIALDYEVSDYDLASEQRFWDKKEAIDYGKTLAERHNLDWVERSHNSGILD